jgi:hypothetical protein
VLHAGGGLEFVSKEDPPRPGPARCRKTKIEPPGRSRVERILGGCRARFERAFCEQAVGRLSATSTDALLELAAGADGPFAETKEQIRGYDLLECKDLDEAIEVASKHPAAKFGRVEVGPLWEE